MELCNSTPECQAFHYLPNLSSWCGAGRVGSCWMKKASEARGVSRGTISGIKAGALRLSTCGPSTLQEKRWKARQIACIAGRVTCLRVHVLCMSSKRMCA
jgi:hypothetical protein